MTKKHQLTYRFDLYVAEWTVSVSFRCLEIRNFLIEKQFWTNFAVSGAYSSDKINKLFGGSVVYKEGLFAFTILNKSGLGSLYDWIKT